MTINEVLSFYKTAINFSKLTGFGRTTWYDWKRLGYIPIQAQHRIELMTQGALKASFNHTQGKKNDN